MLKLVLLLPMAAVAFHVPQVLRVQDDDLHSFKDKKVPVELGVMSRCPDAILCENVFNDVLAKVPEKLDLSLLYIARSDPSDSEFGVKCLHGPDECAGNVQQLCAAKYAPTLNWWEFVQCQNFQGREKIGTPEVALNCAKTAGIDWEDSGMGRCTGMDGNGRGEEGVRLLQESANTTQRRSIQKSCTIIINGRQVCIHDGTWKGCEDGHSVSDFVRQINEAYEHLNRV